jgi:hypothetical protein
VGRSFNGWPIDGLRFRDVRTHSGKKNPFPNSPGGARSIHNAGRGNFLCRGRATHPKILTPRKYWANSRRARTTHHEWLKPGAWGRKTKDRNQQSAEVFAVDGWRAHVEFAQRLSRAFMWHARLLPKISAQIPPG